MKAILHPLFMDLLLQHPSLELQVFHQSVKVQHTVGSGYFIHVLYILYGVDNIHMHVQ